jgi:HAE1 family hydrophobic/amphiphilic exporter-1
MSAHIQKTTLKNTDVSPIVRNYLTNIRVAALAAIVLIVMGTASFFALPRTLSPEVDIPIIFVSTALVGANPEDVESLITIPLEDAARSVSGIDTITAVSSQGFSAITIQFFSSVDADKAKQDVQSVIDTVSNLPDDATSPVVSKLDFEDQPIWSFALISTSNASLHTFAERFRDQLESLPKIDRVVLRGWEEREISVVLDPERFRAFHISPQLIAASVRSAVSAQPAGSVVSDSTQFSLSVDPSVETIADIRDIRIRTNDTSYRLGEIADIAERPLPNQAGALFMEQGNATPQSSITFDVYKSTSERIDTAYEDAYTLVENTIRNEGDTFRVETISSTADDITEQFSDLLRSFATTIALVFLVLFLFFGLRQAIVASLTIPLTFLGAFIVMEITGISISFLSLFSLLLSLGLLVDVTIVILSALTTYWRTGRFSPQEAGLLTWRDYSSTLLVTTLTTVWAFSPLLLATGIIGEFIKPIPIVVSATLLASLVAGLFLVLPFMMALLRPNIPRRVKIFFAITGIVGIFVVGFFAFESLVENPFLRILTIALSVALFWNTGKLLRQKIAKKKERAPHSTHRSLEMLFSDGVLRFERITTQYKSIILSILASKSSRKKTVIITLLVFFFSVGLVGFGLVQNEFFPKENTDILYVELKLPEGTRSEITKEKGIQLATRLAQESAISDMHIQIGAGFSAESGVSSSKSDTALITLNLVDEGNRDISSIALANQIRSSFAEYEDGDVSVYELSGGPPAGADIAITLLGDDQEVIDRFADEIIAHLTTIPGTANVNKSINPGVPKISFIPNQDVFAQNGKMSSDAAMLLRTFANGYTLAGDVSLQDTQEKRDVVLRLDTEPASIDTLNTLAFIDSNAPLSSYGHFELRENQSRITREDGKRSLSVTASVTEGYSVSEIGKEMERFASTLSFPEGYSWKTGGVNEENQKSVLSILQAMLLAMLLILGTLVIHLGSYRKAVIVMLVIPLALIGVFVVFALTGTPLSFPALIGVLALFGIVVNNSIILVDKINQNLSVGLSHQEAAAEASASRLEPIFLSSLTTIIGLIPITLSDPLWQGLGGAIIAGLLFSGTIMLFFIPVVYVMWFQE